MGHSVTLVLKDRICLLLALAGALACSVVPHADGNRGKDGIWYGEGAVFTMGWKTSIIAQANLAVMWHTQRIQTTRTGSDVHAHQ